MQHCSSLLLFNQHRWCAAENFHQAPELVLLMCAWPWLAPQGQGEDGVGVEQYHFVDRRAELLPNSLSSEQGKKIGRHVQVRSNAVGIMAYNSISKWGPSWASHPINSSPPSSLQSQTVSRRRRCPSLLPCQQSSHWMAAKFSGTHALKQGSKKRPKLGPETILAKCWTLIPKDLGQTSGHKEQFTQERKTFTCLNNTQGISKSGYFLRNITKLTPCVSHQFEGFPYKIWVGAIRFQVLYLLLIYPASITLFVHECLPRESELSSGK